MTQIGKAWRTLRIEMELAATYGKAQTARSGSLAIPLHWLDDLMTTLLFIRAMEVHDDALQQEIQRRNETPPKSYYRTLRGRLDYCTDHWPNFPGGTLAKHADRRNELAHEATHRATWRELRQCVEVSIEYERIRALSKQPGTQHLIWQVNIKVNGATHQVWNMTERHEVQPLDGA